MIALDTNVLVRFLTRDDPDQAAAADEVIAGLAADAPAFVCREVAVELVWVLERRYRIPRAEIASALEGLLAAAEIAVEAADDVGTALFRYRERGARLRRPDDRRRRAPVGGVQARHLRPPGRPDRGGRAARGVAAQGRPAFRKADRSNIIRLPPYSRVDTGAGLRRAPEPTRAAVGAFGRLHPPRRPAIVVRRGTVL